MGRNVAPSRITDRRRQAAPYTHAGPDAPCKAERLMALRAVSLGKLALGAVVAACGIAACGIQSSEFSNDDDDDNGVGGAAAGGSSGSFNPTGVGGGGGIVDVPCDNEPGMDGDGDGWTGAEGDCNDCTDLMNPGAYDYAGNNIDEDCDGQQDNTATACDAGLSVVSADAMDAAKAMGLCQPQAGDSWGVISANYIMVDGSSPAGATFDDGHGILAQFGSGGVNPQEGSAMLVLSSGAARNPTDPGYQAPSGYDKGYSSGPAPGFPVESPSCPDTTFTGEARDSIALRLRIKSPTNAKGLSFNVNFYTFEFPNYICSQYNDFVTAILSPTPTGQTNGNISFDAQGNPLSVNAGFLEVCTPQSAGGKTFECTLGAGQLDGTGFEGAAATGWLQTATPLQNPGEEITIEFGAWDSGDGVLDSTGLFDNFEWQLEETPTGTEPVPTPK